MKAPIEKAFRVETDTTPSNIALHLNAASELVRQATADKKARAVQEQMQAAGWTTDSTAKVTVTADITDNDTEGQAVANARIEKERQRNRDYKIARKERDKLGIAPKPVLDTTLRDRVNAAVDADWTTHTARPPLDWTDSPGRLEATDGTLIVALWRIREFEWRVRIVLDGGYLDSGTDTLVFGAACVLKSNCEAISFVEGLRAGWYAARAKCANDFKENGE